MGIIQLDEETKPSKDKDAGVSRKQRAALRYLSKLITIEDKDTEQSGTIKPSIRMVCEKYGIKEDTLLSWLKEDPAFFDEFMAICKTDILRDMRELISAAIEKGKASGDVKTIEFLLRFVSQGYTKKQDFEEGRNEPPESWESVIS